MVYALSEELELLTAKLKAELTKSDALRMAYVVYCFDEITQQLRTYHERAPILYLDANVADFLYGRIDSDIYLDAELLLENREAQLLLHILAACTARNIATCIDPMNPIGAGVQIVAADEIVISAHMPFTIHFDSNKIHASLSIFVKRV